VIDDVDVGKGIGVLVGTKVRVGDGMTVGDCVLACWSLVGVELEKQLTNVMRKSIATNSLNSIFHLSLIHVAATLFHFTPK
jgi:hypothetical protein